MDEYKILNEIGKALGRIAKLLQKLQTRPAWLVEFFVFLFELSWKG